MSSSTNGAAPERRSVDREDSSFTSYFGISQLCKMIFGETVPAIHMTQYATLHAQYASEDAKNAATTAKDIIAKAEAVTPLISSRPNDRGRPAEIIAASVQPPPFLTLNETVDNSSLLDLFGHVLLRSPHAENLSSNRTRVGTPTRQHSRTSTKRWHTLGSSTRPLIRQPRH